MLIALPLKLKEQSLSSSGEVFPSAVGGHGIVEILARRSARKFGIFVDEAHVDTAWAGIEPTAALSGGCGRRDCRWVGR